MRPAAARADGELRITDLIASRRARALTSLMSMSDTPHQRKALTSRPSRGGLHLQPIRPVILHAIVASRLPGWHIALAH